MTQTEILQRAEKLNWPAIVTNDATITNETAWRSAAALPENRANLAAHLDDLEEQIQAREAREAADAHARRPLDFNDPEDWEAQAARQDSEHAAELARRRELPATRGQLDDLIGLTRNVLTALERRR
jgi:hypothetical protein